MHFEEQPFDPMGFKKISLFLFFCGGCFEITFYMRNPYLLLCFPSNHEFRNDLTSKIYKLKKFGPQKVRNKKSLTYWGFFVVCFINRNCLIWRSCGWRTESKTVEWILIGTCSTFLCTTAFYSASASQTATPSKVFSKWWGQQCPMYVQC